MNTVLQAMDLSKTYTLSRKEQAQRKTGARITAVDRLSFDAYEGEIFGLLGPNGAGKTTTLRILSTLIKPDSGDALIKGDSILTSPEQVRRNIAFLTSELKLEEFFSPNYLYDFFSDMHAVPHNLRVERKKKYFGLFGIDKYADVKVANLSTGMKQKAALAISLVHDPSIIIFDEPTNGLDVLTAKTVTDFLLALKQEGHTVIISTHIFSLIEKVCDRVGVIINGSMTRCGALEDVCLGNSLEDSFFEIYKQTVGESI